MKTLLKWILVVVFGIFGLAILGSFAYLYKKSQAKTITWQTESPEIIDLTKKTVATGSIVPRESVDVKPKVTGVLAELNVEPGKIVKQGDPIGKIQIIPDAAQVNNADSQVRSAQIALDNAKRELDREENLYKKGVVSEAEVFKFRTDHALAQQQLQLASSNQQLVREGQTRASGKASTLIVTATVDGTVIDVPVKVGYSVIQANSFNPGTTVATIANMGDMIFDGRVDESEVGKIKKDMRLAIKIGAIDKETFEGKLDYIAPQGKEIDGAIQFEIKTRSIEQKPGFFLRAGYSANADIVLDEKKQVLAIREALVQYDNKDKDKKPYVEVETDPQTFVRHDVKLGLSDGIKVEVLSGVKVTDKVKIPDNAGPAKTELGSASGSGSATKSSTKK
jgi:HlyD family secretion protein